MKTNTTTNQTGGRARVQSEQAGAENHGIWDVILDGEIIGSIHGQTIERARDIVAPLRMKLTVVPHRTVNGAGRTDLTGPCHPTS